MNDIIIEYLLTYGEITAQKDKKIELPLFDEFGDGKTTEDEIIKNLTFTCEEGVDYTSM